MLLTMYIVDNSVEEICIW